MKRSPIILASVFAAASLMAVPVYAVGVAVRHIQIQDQAGGVAGTDWSALSGDLQQALTSKLGGKMSPSGYDLKIRINTLRQASAKQPAELSGTVFVVLPERPTGNGDASSYSSVEKSYDLTVHPSAAGPVKLANAAADQKALANSFADYVVTHL